MPNRHHCAAGRTSGRRALLLALLGFPVWGAGAPPAQPAARWSRQADTVFQHLTQAQGLPQQIATAVAEDGEGFLWVGTQGGLGRWDGYHFRVYKPDSSTAGALPDGYVRVLHTDDRGRLWVGTSGAGLARYDRATDRFIHLPSGPEGVSHVFVRALAGDGAGGLWIGTDGGLDHLGSDLRTFTHHRQGPGGLPHDRVSALLRDAGGRLWVGTKAGLVRQDAPGGPFLPVPLPADKGAAPAIGALWEAPDRRIWVGTSGAGAFVLHPATGEARAIQELGSTGPSIATERIFAIEGAGPGEVWIGTLNQGILAVEMATLATRRIRHDATLGASLPNETIWALHRDRSGLMWVGTGEGLSRTAPSQQAVLTLFGGPGQTRGITDPNVWSVQAMRDGRLWLGLGSNGVDVLDPVEGRVAALRPDPLQPDSALPRDQVLSIEGRSNGEVFLGTQRGLYLVGGPGRRLRRLRFPPHDLAASVDAMVLAGEALWVDSWTDGLWRLDLGAGPTPAPGPRVGFHLPPEALTDRRVNALACAKDGSLWLGTAHGLNRLEPRTGQVERMLPEAGDPQGLAVGTITCLAWDAQDRLWVGLLGGGIQVLEGRDASGRPRFRRLGPAQGLPDANVNKLLRAPDGRMWASTDHGLAVVEPDSLQVRSLQPAEGVAIPAYWGGSGAVTAAGELAFGGGGGLTVVRPELWRPWGYRPPVVVTAARLGGREVPAARLNGEGAGPLEVPPSASSFAVEFAALDYSAPERLRYAYRLDGYDGDWVEADPLHRVATYTHLPPGSYVLRVRGSNRDGMWTERELAVRIRVLPAWFQTWAFRLLEGLAALAGLWGLLRWRVRHLEARSRELERVVAERTRDLAAANAELAKAQEKLAAVMSAGPDLLEDLETWVDRMVEEMLAFEGLQGVAAVAFTDAGLHFHGSNLEDLPPLSRLLQMKTPTLAEDGRLFLPARGPSGEILGLAVAKGGGLEGPSPLRHLLEGFAHQFGVALDMLRVRTRLHATQATQAQTLEEYHAKGIATLQVCPRCGRCYDQTAQTCARDGLALEVPRAMPYRFLGRYRFLRRIGLGGMGAVYSAEDETLARKVAIKLIRPEYVSETAFRLRFEREAQAIAKVQHPGVVTLHDSGSTPDGQLYLIMEHLKGLPVAAMLRQYGKATPAQAGRFLRQGARALQAAHEAGVVHRDLKPANLVLVPQDEEGFQLKILDFGLAQSESFGGSLTRSGAALGTPQYMAPEQILGHATGPKTDLYALAAVVYEVLTRRPVVAEQQISAFLRGTLRVEVPPPSSLVPALPAAVDAAFAAALAWAPEDRPADLVPWADALATLLESVSVPGGWPEVVPKEPRTGSAQALPKPHGRAAATTRAAGEPDPDLTRGM